MHDPSHGVLRALQEPPSRGGLDRPEGVETVPQLAVVRSLGISAAQGYLASRARGSDVGGGIDSRGR